MRWYQLMSEEDGLLRDSLSHLAQLVLKGGRMVSCPYLRVARAYHLDYGDVLHIAGLLERGYRIGRDMPGLSCWEIQALKHNSEVTMTAISIVFNTEMERRHKMNAEQLKDQYAILQIERDKDHMK